MQIGELVRVEEDVAEVGEADVGGTGFGWLGEFNPGGIGSGLIGFLVVELEVDFGGAREGLFADGFVAEGESTDGSVPVVF